MLQNDGKMPQKIPDRLWKSGTFEALLNSVIFVMLMFSDFPGDKTDHWYDVNICRHLGMGWTRVVIALGIQMNRVSTGNLYRQSIKPLGARANNIK